MDRDDHGVFVGGGESGALMRSVDWSKTALGPVETWPQSLRTSVSILLDSRFPMYIAWGPSFTQLYNDGYRPILGSTKHPAAMGSSAPATFAESWHIIGPMFDGVRRGTAVGSEDWMLPLDRNGFLEECYFTFSYSPIRDESGGVGGVSVIVTETTGRVLGERRLRTLRELAPTAATAPRIAQSEDESWKAAAQALARNAFDIPFALLYRCRPGTQSPELAASAGWTDGAARFDDEATTSKWPFDEAGADKGGALVADVRARFGDLPGGAWPEAPASAMVLRLARSPNAEAYGFLVVGVSARLALDGDYRSFLELVADQTAALIGNARSFEEERLRGEDARRLLDEAQRATRSRDETLASVSHDLRTPLGSISNAAQLIDEALGSEARDDRLRKWTHMIERSVERMNRMLADLLDLASIEAGTLSFEPRPQAAAELAEELRETFGAQANEKGSTLEVVVADDLPSFAGDRERILQALGNLLSNAIKFTPAGGTVRLRAALDDGGAHVRFSVEDTGPGIPLEAQRHVFDRHWHGGERSGHGLGLAIAKGIATAHGGLIDLTSAPGSGTTLTMALPLAPSRVLAPAPSASEESFASGGGELGALTRAFDWSTTALGPMKDWPQSLRTSVSTMLRSPYPITLFWGPELVMLYNDPFRPIHGDKHPQTLGASARRALAEAWDVLGPLVQKTLDTGAPLYVENGLVMFARQPGGLKEESYFTWSYNPTIGEDGTIAGLFAIASETTRQVVGDRRLATLRDLSLRAAYDRSIEAALRSCEVVLADAGADVPFALLYTVENEQARLAVCTGVERGSTAAPTSVRSGEACPWPLEAVAASGEEVLLRSLDATLGPLPGGPWPEGATSALVLRVPIGRATHGTGVLVAGLSPRRSVDDDYRSFIQLLARQISASISSARAYEEEQQRAEKLAELDRAKTDFFSNVSHELRTPLTLILGPVEDALGRSDAVLGGETLEVVHRNALRLYKMVNTLLDFSRVEAGRAQATFLPTDLAAFTASLASHFQSAAERAGIELSVVCPPLPDAVYVDPDLWEKIVVNLLSNALKYTYRGRIEVRLRAEEGTAVLTVEDTGVGIAEAEQAHVFERFYRVRDARGRSHEGTGIGLALARELVELHGGTVSVASTLGSGSTFTVRVPRGAAHLPADRVKQTPGPRSSAGSAAPYVQEAMRWSTGPLPSEPASPAGARAAPLLPLRILLVDDNADLRKYVADLLGAVYETVVMAANGSEALERARANPPDLVLADVMMPELDGFALVRALRADRRTRSIPIILLSARAGDEATVEGLDSGADDYLVKPFSARELMARVQAQIEMSRARAEIWRERGHVDALQRSLAARDEFIAISSHELRTPLTALRIQIETLLLMNEDGQRELAAGRVVTKLGSALRQVDRMTRLVEALLDASQIAMNGLVLAPAEVELDTLVRTVVARLEDDARASKSRIEVEASPVRGEWDARRLEQVIGGVIANAIKYAPETVIHVVVDADAEHARITVRDTGMGIPQDALVRVFERFERAVSIGSYGGFGIGLYLARQIVEAHGGTIHASPTSAAGGTTIVVSLPLRGAGSVS